MKLLPNYYKIVGLALAVLTILINDSTIFWFKRLMDDHTAIYQSPSGFMDAFIAIGPIVGLLLFVFSKEKVEDEWSVKVRQQSLGITLILGVLLVVIEKFVGIAMYLPDTIFDSHADFDTLLKMQMFTYIVAFQVKKRFGI